MENKVKSGKKGEELSTIQERQNVYCFDGYDADSLMTETLITKRGTLEILTSRTKVFYYKYLSDYKISYRIPIVMSKMVVPHLLLASYKYYFFACDH